MAAAMVGVFLLLAQSRDAGASASISSYAFGKRYTVTVTGADVAKSPVWKDDADNPPLSARKAMKLAGAKKDKLVRNSDDWSWEQDSASLMEMGAGRWYWLVSYEARGRPGTGGTGGSPTLRLVVLMDGTVIEPEVAPDKPRK